MKEKLKKHLVDNKWLYITFFVSLCIICIIYIFKNISPFGNNSMLDVDFYHQYGPLLNELNERIRNGKTLLYSFNTGGGLPFYRNFYNYLSSPFNLIMFFFKNDDIVTSFSIIIGLKAVFASVFMAFYLKKVFNKNDISILVFGLLYAYSGYFCAYYWNIMWLDGMVFLPIIMYGINRIIDDKKPLLYTISLAVMLFSNYFIGYMICIFCVFYFIIYFIYKGNFKPSNIAIKSFIFFSFSILAAGLVSFFLLPLFYSLKSISATTNSFPDIKINFSLINFLFNHLQGVNRTVFMSDKLPLPNVYCGILTITLIPIMFFNKKISKKFKILSFITLLFFFFSFNISSLDFIWHGFHVPNDLPYRYSFLYVFSLIVIAYYSFINIKYESKLRVSICFMIMFIFIMLSSKLSFKNISDDRVIINMILLAIYFCIYLLSFSKKNIKFLLNILIVIVVSFECSYPIIINWNINHDIKTFMESKKNYTNLINYAKKIDNDLYRMEKEDYLTLNDGAWSLYNGISTFSSMAYYDTSKFQKMFGLAGNNINSYYYRYRQTPIYNTIFDVKYILGSNNYDPYYNVIYKNNDYSLNLYKYSSSIMYKLDNEIENLTLVSDNPFLNQSNFVLYSTGVNDIYEKIKVLKIDGATINNTYSLDDFNGSFSYSLNGKKISITLENERDSNIYLYIAGNNLNGIYVDGKYYSITSDENYILNIGYKLKGNIDVSLEFNNINDGILDFYAYHINDNKFKEFYNKINENKLKVEKYSDTSIFGDINSDYKGTMFTTLSYDKGFTVFVDGKRVKTKKLLNAYLGFDIEKGKHKIKVVYYPYMQKQGLTISIISFIIISVYFFFKDGKKIKIRAKR